MNKKRIELTFHLEQICNDVLAKCNHISKNIKDEGLEDIKASVQAPDDAESRSIINRALTEAFGRVKVACQRYMIVGRTIDNNKLERLVKSITYVQEEREVQDTDAQGRLLYLITTGLTVITAYESNGTYYKCSDNSPILQVIDTVEPKMVTKMVETDEIASLEYEDISLTLDIENFNISVTDDLKSAIHKFVVDYIMGRFLQDLANEKAGEYKALADGEDYRKIISDLNCRESYTMRKPSFI